MSFAFRKILVPTDFSETGEAALHYAKELARQFNAELHLLHVCEDPVLPAGWSMLASGPAPDVGEEAAALREQLKKLLTAEDQKLLKTEVHVILGQPTGLAISRYAVEGEFELIVMGTHGRGPVTHALMGSVAEKVVRSAPCPVLTIRHPTHRKIAIERLRDIGAAADTKWGSQMELAMPNIGRILCPVDFSDASAHVVDQATAIAGWYKARIVALHVYSPLVISIPTLPPPVERVPQTEIERMRDSTRACFQAAAAAGIGVDVAVDIGQPTAEILDRAEKLPADLIVMGTNGAGGFEHFVLGSVAEKVIRKAACPVLTVPPRSRATSVLPFKRLLCAVDFFNPSLAALAFSCSLARESGGAALTILHVIEWPWVEPPGAGFEELPREQAAALAEFRRYLEKSAMGRLEKIVPHELRAHCTPQPAIRHGKPYVEILRAAEEISADLIVVGIHGRNVVGMTLIGSTTNQVVRRATCPVLTLKQ